MMSRKPQRKGCSRTGNTRLMLPLSGWWRWGRLWVTISSWLNFTTSSNSLSSLQVSQLLSSSPNFHSFISRSQEENWVSDWPRLHGKRQGQRQPIQLCGLNMQHNDLGTVWGGGLQFELLWRCPVSLLGVYVCYRLASVLVLSKCKFQIKDRKLSFLTSRCTCLWTSISTRRNATSSSDSSRRAMRRPAWWAQS